MELRRRHVRPHYSYIAYAFTLGMSGLYFVVSFCVVDQGISRRNQEVGTQVIVAVNYHVACYTLHRHC